MIKCFILFLSFTFFIPASANDDHNFARNLLNQAQGNFSKPDLNKEVPGYSRENENKVSSQLNAIAPEELEKRGTEKTIKDRKDNPNAAIHTLDGASSLKNMENIDVIQKLELFTRSDKVMNDPLKVINELTEEECKDLENDLDKGYHVKRATKSKTEEVKYTDICEMGGLKLNCSQALKLTCNTTETCNTGGIVLDSIASDMKFFHHNGVLLIGTIADNYWSGSCAIFKRETKFSVKDKDLLKEFRLFEAGFDDHIEIKINGHIVYVGPYGGTKLEVVDYRVHNGKGTLSCELNSSWHRSLDIDLLPYLNEGENNITMTVVVSGRGEGWFKIAAKQHCCKEWIEEWVDHCEPFTRAGGE